MSVVPQGGGGGGRLGAEWIPTAKRSGTCMEQKGRHRNVANSAFYVIEIRGMHQLIT